MNETRSRAVEILATGPLALIQDLGRPGLAALGISRSGAADRGALRLANRLLANDEGAAAIEVLLGGLAMRPITDLLVAVTGADVPITIEGRTAPHHSVLHVRAGEVLTIGTATRGLRAYVAVRGGLAVPPVLGSRSRDTLSGIGPAPLQAGQTLPIGHPPSVYPVVAAVSVRHSKGCEAVLPVSPGPRMDWISDVQELVGAKWHVSHRSDRIGVRLEGPQLRRPRGLAGQELPSEGLVRGAVQLPPGGGPVVFGPDHPTTGGYPVVVVLGSTAADRAAQLRPGDVVRFALRTDEK
jgi:biotin-dependent carboxylase-like uncharacterized protein